MADHNAPKSNSDDSQPTSGSIVLEGYYARRVAEETARAPVASTSFFPVVPLSTEFFADKLTFVADAEGVASLVNFATQRPLCHVGFDTEFRYLPRYDTDDQPDGDDPRSVQPLLLSFTLVEPTEDGQTRVYRFVVDVRAPELVKPLTNLFALPIPFVAHYVTAELMCLWKLGLEAPDQIWDTWVAERTFELGIHHARYLNPQPVDEVAEIAAKEDADTKRESGYSLLAVCHRRGIKHPFSLQKEDLQKTFLSHAIDAPFTEEQLEYVSADADAAARLYRLQVQIAAENGSLKHLVEVEMPWATTNACMTWNGIRVNPELCAEVVEGCRKHGEKLASELRNFGIDNARSNPQLKAYFAGMSQLDHFRTSTGNYSFNDKNLEKVEGTLPVAGTIRQYRKVMRLVSDQTFSGKLIGADGRLHPLHRQLGTETGRNGMRNPNIGGIGKMLRPIVVPDEGYQIGEVDLSQIEPGIAAAWFRDPHLIKMFNTGDIYSAIVRRYYADVLTADDQRLPDREFKRKFSTYRDRMKIFTLATIYNITPHGLGLRLGISTASASEQQRKFLELFPVLARALREASEYGIIRGSAYTISGLRRHRVRAGLATTWEENWLRNAPIQGSAAVVFKVAGNRLARRYRYYGARLILPLHDAYVFETPVGTLDEVAEVTRQVMTSVVQEYFPALNPQAEVNILDPTCWNKDGKGNSLREWLIAAEDIDIIED